MEREDVKVCPHCNKQVCMIIGLEAIDEHTWGNSEILPTKCSNCGTTVTKEAQNWDEVPKYREQTEEEMRKSVHDAPLGVQIGCPVCGWMYGLFSEKTAEGYNKSAQAEHIIAHQKCSLCGEHLL